MKLGGREKKQFSESSFWIQVVVANIQTVCCGIGQFLKLFLISCCRFFLSLSLFLLLLFSRFFNFRLFFVLFFACCSPPLVIIFTLDVSPKNCIYFTIFQSSRGVLRLIKMEYNRKNGNSIAAYLQWLRFFVFASFIAWIFFNQSTVEQFVHYRVGIQMDGQKVTVEFSIHSFETKKIIKFKKKTLSSHKYSKMIFHCIKKPKLMTLFQFESNHCSSNDF